MYHEYCTLAPPGPLPPFCSDYTTLNVLSRVSLYDFKFTVYNACIVYQIWYPNPDHLGKFEHTTFGKPLVVNYLNFIMKDIKHPCSNPTLKLSISVSFNEGPFIDDPLPPFLTYDFSQKQIKITNTNDLLIGTY